MFVSQGKNAELRVCGDCCICTALEGFALRLLCLNAKFICEPGKVVQGQSTAAEPACAACFGLHVLLSSMQESHALAYAT